MSMNTAHQGGGILLYSGECILLYADNVNVEFNSNPELPNGTKTGTLYLTTHRMVFINKNHTDKVISFSFPFITLRDVDIEQPVFGANYIKGKVRSQPNGNWNGEAKFKLMFKKGGAIEFGQAMLKTVHMATGNGPVPDVPPPYSPPTGPWYQAPPPAYTPPAAGYYGWVPPTHAFPEPPPASSVYMTDMPPPYPGINGYSGYNTSYANATAPPPPMGFSVPPESQNGKASDAAQSAYYDPNRPQCAYVPPPSYYEPPPSYQMNGDKKTQ
ncbi:WW domain-binding protein 2 isoform X1 [Planococcus citri]|uniref:WW domain-binding protein 2 isoform X1 n=1 Tax=Planococcus citri TaxID=170843 RepID=UPI0031F7AF55